MALVAIAGVCEEQPATAAATKTPSTEPEPAPASPKDAAAKPTRPSGIRPQYPPPAPSLDEARGPDVTLIAGESRTVYEYRQNGKLLMIKVVPQGGKPYFLAPKDPTTGFGDLEQADTLVPRWVLIEF